MNFNYPDQKTTVTLIRCGCKHCDTAEETLKKLVSHYGADLKIEQAEKKEGFKELAGWSTPIVTVDGKEISHFKIDQKKWEQAIQGRISSVPSKMSGEIVCMKCYMEKESQGLQHEACATACIQKGGPVGLLSQDEHRVYLLLEDPANRKAFEDLKNMAAEKIRVIGEVCRKEGTWAIVVKESEMIF